MGEFVEVSHWRRACLEVMERVLVEAEPVSTAARPPRRTDTNDGGQSASLPGPPSDFRLPSGGDSWPSASTPTRAARDPVSPVSPLLRTIRIQ